MPERYELLVVNPQQDYCDPTGALYVRGADAGMTRLGQMVSRMRDRLQDVVVTLESHPDVHIAHPVFWVDRHGRHPKPFTVLSAEAIRSGEWTPSVPGDAIRARAVRYAEELEREGRYPFVVWPPHCISGGLGQAIAPQFFGSLRDWAVRTFSIPTIVTFGTHPFTDYRSAVQADVPDRLDPTTQRNETLLARLLEAETVLLAGQPATHAFAGTVRDVIGSVQDRTNLQKFVLLTDATSPATGFESVHDEFLSEMKARRMRFASVSDF